MRLRQILPVVVSLLQAGTAAAERPTIYLSFTVTDNSLIDPHAAHAAAAPLIRRLGQMSGERVSFVYIPKAATLLEKLKAGKVHFAITSSLVFVELAAGLELQPLTLAKTAGRCRYRLLLLVQNGSPVKKLAQLRGKKISINRRHRSGWTFLENQLHRIGAAAPSAFFGDVRSPERTKSVILDLLMGDVGACVTSDAAIKAMGKLNPQVESRFRVVARSPLLATPVLFAAKGAPAVKKLKRVALRLHKDPVGRQLLMIFRIERMVAVGETAFETQRALYKEHEKHKKHKKHKKKRHESGGASRSR